MTKLSHSAKDKVMTCGAMYKYHYIDRIRPINASSALFFGKALDEAFNCLLATKMDNPPQDLLDCPYKTFDKYFDTFDLNGEIISTLDIRCDYFKSDVDITLVSNPDRVAYLQQNRDKLDTEEYQEFINAANHCLREKAKLMIDAYKTEVIPKIHKVHSLQEEVKLPNDSGDEIIGFIDFICSFVDDPDTIYIVDNKTASKNYKEDSVRTSEQLATYCDYKLVDTACFIVINKTLRKKEPRINVQIIKDTISDETFKKVFDTYQVALHTIKSEEYYKNYDSGCFFFGKKCPYFSWCRSGSMKGLIKVNKNE